MVNGPNDRDKMFGDFDPQPRSGTDRRSGDGDWNDIDRRGGGERRQFSGGGLTYGCLFVTRGSVAEVEEWLEGNCSGRWSLELEDLSDDLKKKKPTRLV